MTRKPTELADYSDVFGVEAGLPILVIVGGQAANAWAIYYSKRIGRKLARYRPFTSKDLDISKVWPISELVGSGMQKIQRFVHYRLS